MEIIKQKEREREKRHAASTTTETFCDSLGREWENEQPGPTRFPLKMGLKWKVPEGEAPVPVEKLLFATPRRDVEPAIDKRGFGGNEGAEKEERRRGATFSALNLLLDTT